MGEVAAAHVRQAHEHESLGDQSETNEDEEGCLPAYFLGEEETERNAQWRRRRKTRVMITPIA